MHNSYIASTISLRTRTPLSYDCSNPYYPCLPSSPLLSRTGSCPCCCASSICGFPTSPIYCYNLYGLRQSSLIQRSPYRKVIPYGFDRCCYTRVPVYGAERRYCCVDVSKIRERIDRVCNIREKHLVGRRAGYRNCTVFEERIESCDLEGVDEAEALLSLLADDTDDDDDNCFLVRKEDKRRLIKKPFLEKRETSEVCNECGSRKKKSDSDVSESGRRRGYGPVLTSSMKENERIRKENEKDHRVSLSEENRRVKSREECSNSSSKSRVAREREEIEKSSRITNVSNSNIRQERESALRIEDWEVKKRRQEREDLSRKEEQRQRLRRDGSSCSSYYSLSSTGDYESENDHEIKEGVLREESSSGHKGNSRIGEVVYRKSNEENRSYEDHREENEFSLTKKSAAKEIYSSSGVVESDFRKKSEKKLADVSIEEMDSRDNTLHKDEKFSMSHESDYKKSSDYYVTNDDKKSKVTQSVNIDVERIQQQRQQALDDEVSRKHENKMKYKRFLEIQEARADDVRNTYGSEKIYGGKNEMSSQVVSSGHGDVKEHRSGVGVSIRDDEYQKTSHKVSDVTKIQEIDIKRTSITDQRFQTSVKEENIISSENKSSKERKRYDQLSVTGGAAQNLSKKQATSIFGKQSNDITMLEETVNVEDTNNETVSEIIVKPSSSNLKETEQFRFESNVENFGNKVTDGTIRSESSSLHGPKLKRSPALHELPSKFSSQEDAIESASRLEKSAARYAGEFVEKAKNEILSSEHKKNETKLELEERQEQKNLVQYISGDSQSKKSDSRENDRISGTKGPRDEMWRVEEPAAEESRVEGESSGDGKTLVKRSGKTLWNIISDIVLLRWSPRSETTHYSGKKTNGKSSPNQSTSSETWFSGHEAEQASPDKVEQPSILGLSPESREHNKAHSKVEEASSSLTKDSITSISLPSGKEIIAQGDYGTTSSVALTDPTRLPSLKLRRSPIVRAVSESGETSTSDSGISEQPNTDLTESSEQVVNEARLKKLQRKDQIMRNEFDEWEEAYRLESEQRKIDEFFMREALLEAEKAADKWEVPVGAVLVHDGKIIARGYNLVEELRDSTAHAEMACIRQASNVLRTWRLSETTLYVTLEPCPMCAGAILQARIDCVVWGAPNKLLGADGSWIRLFPSGDGGDSLDQSDKPPAPVHPFHPKIVVRRGVLASECADTMQQFFKLRRKKKDNIKPETPPSSVACLPISHHHPSKLLTKMHGAFHLMFCL